MLHRRKRNRLRGFNYAQDRLYFITTCVHDRACVFGEVVAHEMILNECGLIADRQWQWLEKQYPYVRLHTHIVMPNHVHAIIEINRGYIHAHDKIVRTGRDPSVQFYRDMSLQLDRDPSVQLDCDPSVQLDCDPSVQMDCDPSEQLDCDPSEQLDCDPTVHPDSPVEIHTPSANHKIPNNISDSGYLGQSIKIKSISELIGAYKTTSSKQIHQIQAEDGSYPHKSFLWHRSFHDRIIRNEREFGRIAAYIDRNPRSWSRDKFYL